MPETVQMFAALLVENVKLVSPLDAVAVNVIGDALRPTGDTGTKVTVCMPWLMTTLALADAMAYTESPYCVAARAHVPTPIAVS